MAHYLLGEFNMLWNEIHQMYAMYAVSHAIQPVGMRHRPTAHIGYIGRAGGKV